jgi:beta-glucanase (GH16 family)
MKRISAVGFAAVVLALVMCSFARKGRDRAGLQAEDKAYQLVFSDEFNLQDGAQPDPKVWSRSVRGTSRWNRWISRSSDVVFIRDGKLVCRAIPNTKEHADTATMLTGAVDTRSSFAFQYGKIEVRMRTNMQPGNFPAAWLLPKQPAPAHPYSGEIDIMESYGLNPNTYHTAHSYWTTDAKQAMTPCHQFHEKVDVTQWHVYGLEWTKDQMTWTVDGKVVGTYKRLKTKKARKGLQWPYTRPFYIILNQSVGDQTWDQTLAKAPQLNTTYETEFDWVRVYSLRK